MCRINIYDIYGIFKKQQKIIKRNHVFYYLWNVQGNCTCTISMFKYLNSCTLWWPWLFALSIALSTSTFLHFIALHIIRRSLNIGKYLYKFRYRLQLKKPNNLTGTTFLIVEKKSHKMWNNKYVCFTSNLLHLHNLKENIDHLIYFFLLMYGTTNYLLWNFYTTCIFTWMHRSLIKLKYLPGAH